MRSPMRSALVAALLVAGCSYESQYVAPKDGRPRAVWRGNHIAVDSGGVPLGLGCLTQIAWETATERIQLTDGDRTAVIPERAPYVWQPRAAFWIPLWWGLPPPPPIGGLAPPLPAPPLFVAPSLARRYSLSPGPLPAPSVRVGAVGAPAVRVGGGGGGGDIGKGLAYLAIVALIVMPVVDVALAVAPAESVSASVRGIDQANALIDLARLPGSPCAPVDVDDGAVPQ